MADFKKAIKFSLDGVEQSIKNVGELAKFLKDAKKGVDSLDDTKLAGLRDSLNEVESQLGEVSKKNEGLTKSFTDFTKTVNTKIPVNSIKNFKVQLADLEDQLEGLEVGSDSFKAIKKQADALKITLESVEQNASETRQQFVDLGKGIAESLVSAVGTFKVFTSGQEEADRVLENFGKTMLIVESIEKAAIAVKEIDKFVTAQTAVATVTATTATNANTVATAANTATTETATVVQKGFTNSLIGSAKALVNLGKFLLTTPLGLFITGLAAVVGYLSTVYKSSTAIYEDAVKQFDRIKGQTEAGFNKLKALRDKNAADIDNDIERQRQNYQDEIDILEQVEKQKALALEKANKLLQLARDTGNQEFIAAEEQRLADLIILFDNNEQTLKEKKRESSEFEIDIARRTASILEDIELEKLNAKKDFTTQFIVNEKNKNKELADLEAKRLKGELVKTLENGILVETEYLETKKLLNIKYNNIELDLKKQLTDKLIELNNKVADSQLNRTLNNLRVQTKDINKDYENANEAIRLQQEDADKKALKTKEQAIKDLGALQKNADEETIKKYNDLFDAIEKSYQEDVQNNKDAAQQQTKDLNLENQARLNNELLARLEINEAEVAGNQLILDDTKESYNARIEANNKLLESTIARLKFEESILLQNANLTDKEIENIKNKTNLQITEAEKTVAAQNKIFEGRKQLFKSEADFDAFVKGTEQIEQSLTNIAALGLDTKINSIIQSIASSTGAVKTLSQSLDEIGKKDYDKLFGEFADEQKLADQTKAYGEAAIAITASINSAIQAVTDAQLTDLDTKLAKIQELKDKIDEDLDKTREDIRELQSNLAEAQLEDRERLIKKIAKQRAAEKALADQKVKAIKDENELLAKQKELKKQAFIANKIASGIQAAINTAVGITAALTIPPPAGEILAGVIGALGAVQIAAIAAAPIPEFATGGFTEKGDKNEVAGVVHKGEWVAPKWMVESPKFNGVINELESNRQNGFANGGFVSASNNTAILQEVREQNKVLSAIAERPVVVSVQEINSVNSTVKRTQVKSTLN